MMEMVDVARWNSQAAASLRDAAAEIERAAPPEEVGSFAIAFKDLAEGAAARIGTATSSIARDRAIYIITLDADSRPDELSAAFEKTREEQAEEMKLPQFNRTVGQNSGNPVLYVGSSFATEKRARTTRARLRQHLVKAPRGTYALNLAQWAANQPGGIVVTVYNYPEATPRSVVVAVEDVLSQRLSPLFGRRGTQR